MPDPMEKWWIEATEHEGVTVYEDADDQQGPAGPFNSEREAWAEALDILLNRRDHLRDAISAARANVRRTAGRKRPA